MLIDDIALGYIDGLVQDCSNSSALAMELLQSCTEPSIWLCVIWCHAYAVHLCGWKWKFLMQCSENPVVIWYSVPSDHHVKNTIVEIRWCWGSWLSYLNSRIPYSNNSIYSKRCCSQFQCMKRSAMTRSLTKLDAYVFHYKFKWLTAILR